jgi:hypothetical protein
MLSVLSEFKEFNELVVEGVQDELAEKHSFVIISKPFYQHTVNEILDGCIDSFMATLSPEQKQQFVEKMREVKARYYERFKKLVPVEISQKSGVRFDANQILEETIMGELTKEIATKGYTSSDVRKIKINEDELQLPISKIKENVKENENDCKRDNAKAKDIVEGRKLTTEFYKSLEARKKVDMLSPDTSLIEHVIEGKAEEKSKGLIAAAADAKASKGKTAGGAAVSAGGNGKKDDKKKATNAKKPEKKAAPGGKKPEKKAAPSNVKKGAESAKSGTKADSNKKEGSLTSAAMYGSGAKPGEKSGAKDSKKEDIKEKNGLLDEFARNRNSRLTKIKRSNTREAATEINAESLFSK